MAKKQTFGDKSSKKSTGVVCPACDQAKQYVKHVKAVKTDSGWKFRSLNIGVCKCNEKEVYA